MYTLKVGTIIAWFLTPSIHIKYLSTGYPQNKLSTRHAKVIHNLYTI